jgi:hypothetical protein
MDSEIIIVGSTYPHHGMPEKILISKDMCILNMQALIAGEAKDEDTI